MAGAKAGSLAEALAATVLGEFEGKDVRRAGIEIPNIAGGLRKAMKIQPRVMRQGERGWIAFEYVVDKIKFEPIDGDNPGGDQERIHVLVAEGATFVTEELVGDAIREQKAAIAKAEQEAKGQYELGETPPPAESSTEPSTTGGKRGGRGKQRGAVAAVPDLPEDADGGGMYDDPPEDE